jgi:aspartate kinase
MALPDSGDRRQRLIKRFEIGQVAVVAGFQGIGPDNRLATLGRGGSDTSAVAIAAAVRADRCDIYTDVDGVYTTDPRVEPKARRMKKIAFEEMLEMASLGRQGASGALGGTGHGAQGSHLRALQL